ncbi:hypothetical protein E6O75_ATG07857 [Venturia nashicola]|uniref:Uncharacterized protein n=1 Tax=Venturia nashicola TaxID=86259 RepID=A0A4Z1NWR7_9PEZI|nr:hypothetical protein E6O75_ATG07857 [Venturia nashicola]
MKRKPEDAMPGDVERTPATNRDAHYSHLEDNKTIIQATTKDNFENGSQDPSAADLTPAMMTMTGQGNSTNTTTTASTADLARKMLQTLADYAKQLNFQLMPPEIQIHCLNARIGLRLFTILRRMIYRYCLGTQKSGGITHGDFLDRLRESNLHLASQTRQL